MMVKISSILLFLVLVSTQTHAQQKAKFSDLPEPVTNNAVAIVKTKQSTTLLSFMGLGENKTYQDVHNKAWKLSLNQNAWQVLPVVPSSLPLKGRLAAVATAVADKVYLFGGYTVAADHNEISSPDNFQFDVTKNTYTTIADMPIPVDDSVALVYQQKYIYLISGWHNDGNVNLVQIYDVQNDAWHQATPFPGDAVFGHAGGIVDNVMLVCDGVKVTVHKNKRRSFDAEPACYRGTIAPENFKSIDWRKVQHPTGRARYRMAATGLPQLNQVVLFGGSPNPYNYNGIGYNKEPSTPTSMLWQYHIASGQWTLLDTHLSSMDHRGLLATDEALLVVGGMIENQQVSQKVQVVTWLKNLKESQQ